MSTVTRRMLAGLAASSFATLTLPCREAWAEPDPVRMGVITSVTGPYSDQGGLVTRIVQFAVDQANKAGGVDGRKVEFRVLDTEGKPDIARRQAEKLALAGYNLLIGLTAS